MSFHYAFNSECFYCVLPTNTMGERGWQFLDRKGRGQGFGLNLMEEMKCLLGEWHPSRVLSTQNSSVLFRALIHMASRIFQDSPPNSPLLFVY